ncbi:MAG: 30S ribosome-binding factor RbfA [Lachnospiraceae bacterium]|nr:30S ribosome-binding factor RbfA [Lachnospiraceae bacterium]
MRKNSVKLTRINQEIVRELSEIIRSEVKDPRVGMMTSVTGADTTTDLKSCKVYISVLGGEEALATTMEGLNACRGFLRRMLAQNLNLRNTPELIFIADRSIEYGTHIAGILDEMHRNGTFSSDDIAGVPSDAEQSAAEEDKE